MPNRRSPEARELLLECAGKEGKDEANKVLRCFGCDPFLASCREGESHGKSFVDVFIGDGRPLRKTKRMVRHGLR